MAVEDLSDLRVTISVSESKIKQLTLRNAELEQDVERLEQQRSTQKTQLKDSEARIEDLESAASKLTSEKNRMRDANESLQEELRASSDKVARANTQIRQLQDQVAVLEEALKEIASLKLSNSQLEAKVIKRLIISSFLGLFFIGPVGTDRKV